MDTDQQVKYKLNTIVERNKFKVTADLFQSSCKHITLNVKVISNNRNDKFSNNNKK